MTAELESWRIEIQEIKTVENGMVLFYWFVEDYIKKRVIFRGKQGLPILSHSL